MLQHKSLTFRVSVPEGPTDVNVDFELGESGAYVRAISWPGVQNF
jgi:hypothetical protein